MINQPKANGGRDTATALLVTLLVVPMLAFVVLASGCGGDSGRPGPLTPIASTPPGGYPLDRELPGGTIEAVPAEEAPVAKPLRETLPPVNVPELPTGVPVTPPLPPEKIPSPPAPTEKGSTAPAPAVLDPNAGQTIPLANAVLAEINGDVITREDILGPLRPQIAVWSKQLSKEELERRCREHVAEDLRKEISRRLVLQEAKATLSENEKKEVDEQVKLMESNMISEAGSKPRLEARLTAEGSTLEHEKAHERDNLLIQRLLRQKVSMDVRVTHSELLARYESLKAERFMTSDRAHLLMITLKKGDSADPVQARALAEAVYDRARRGEDFGKLAAQYSRDSRAKEGGDWGFVGRGGLKATAVDTALFALKRNELAPVIETADCYYIVKCLEREEARTKPFTEVQADLEREMRQERRNQAVEKYVQDLFDRAYKRILTENL